MSKTFVIPAPLPAREAIQEHARNLGYKRNPYSNWPDYNYLHFNREIKYYAPTDKLENLISLEEFFALRPAPLLKTGETFIWGHEVYVVFEEQGERSYGLINLTSGNKVYMRFIESEENKITKFEFASWNVDYDPTEPANLTIKFQETK